MFVIAYTRPEQDKPRLKNVFIVDAGERCHKVQPSKCFLSLLSYIMHIHQSVGGTTPSELGPCTSITNQENELQVFL